MTLREGKKENRRAKIIKGKDKEGKRREGKLRKEEKNKGR